MARVTCVVWWVLMLRRVVTSVTEGLSGMKSAEQAYRIRRTNTILNGFATSCSGEWAAPRLHGRLSGGGGSAGGYVRRQSAQVGGPPGV